MRSKAGRAFRQDSRRRTEAVLTWPVDVTGTITCGWCGKPIVEAGSGPAERLTRSVTQHARQCPKSPLRGAGEP
jgi:hypothetical protein